MDRDKYAAALLNEAARCGKWYARKEHDETERSQAHITFLGVLSCMELLMRQAYEEERERESKKLAGEKHE